ncbi:c-type cytochrome [Thalassospira xiamenensis]|uniref:c-type cytochrome n=1 Tax=Thalassospira xiamenensis TaxID=220697 RepID=UPI0015F0B231|nr:cytochrome c [Thalassospira xiamenensis]
MKSYGKHALWAQFCLFLPMTAQAAELQLTSPSGIFSVYQADELLSHPQARDIVVANDGGYGQDMTYRAVPLVSLIGDANSVDDQTGLEVIALDGFVANIPVPLIIREGDEHAQAWLAIEPEDAPWPNLPGKDVSAGPFSVVWVNAAASHIRSEQWPYQVSKIGYAEFPPARWPQLALADGAPDNAKQGQTIFIDQCFACHRMNGAGITELGPNLNLPMNPVDYFKPEALVMLIRDPASVRHWPDMQMHGFTTDQLSDAEIRDVIAYLQAMAGRKAE